MLTILWQSNSLSAKPFSLSIETVLTTVMKLIDHKGVAAVLCCTGEDSPNDVCGADV